MSYLPEVAKIYPTLSGHSVLIVESTQTAGELFANLIQLQSMEVDFIEAARFPSNLAKYMEKRALDSSIIHVPGVATDNRADAYYKNVHNAYEFQPRMIILEGAPSNWETIKMYEALKTIGTPMLNKYPYLEVIKKLAELFE